MPITQKDLIDSVMGLQEMAGLMRKATEDNPLVEGMASPCIPMKISTVLSNAQYLETVAKELLDLIPDQNVPTPPKE